MVEPYETKKRNPEDISMVEPYEGNEKRNPAAAPDSVSTIKPSEAQPESEDSANVLAKTDPNAIENENLPVAPYKRWTNIEPLPKHNSFDLRGYEKGQELRKSDSASASVGRRQRIRSALMGPRPDEVDDAGQIDQNMDDFQAPNVKRNPAAAPESVGMVEPYEDNRKKDSAATPEGSPVAQPYESSHEETSTRQLMARNSTNLQFTGAITHYTPSTSSCGFVNNEADAVIALHTDMMKNGANPNHNPLCGKTITIFNPKTRTTFHAKIVDTCAGCTSVYNIDVSPSLFKTVAPDGDGKVSGIQWGFDPSPKRDAAAMPEGISMVEPYESKKRDPESISMIEPYESQKRDLAAAPLDDDDNLNWTDPSSLVPIPLPVPPAPLPTPVGSAPVGG